jgi:dTDP-4-dehydrorhamnose 3,5-epimerase
MTNLVVTPGPVSGVRVWQHKVFEDTRGKLSKVYVFDSEELGNTQFQTFEHFFTFSKLNVFRGMHLQSGIHSSAKIISLVHGSVTDFLLDLRADSSTFGKLQVEKIDDKTPQSVYVPKGVAHGYLSHSDNTIFSYRYEVAFCQECDSGINPKVIELYLGTELEQLILSDRDRALSDSFREAVNIRTHK